MIENLRHLRALQAFDETAKHSNLSKAAGILNVTHGAVSRQIKLLELYLGVKLFHRRPNGMELSKAGEQLQNSTKQAFHSLRQGVQDVKRQHQPQSIKVSLSTSLALKWFVPNLSSFHKSHPDITLLLDTNDSFTDFDTAEVDVALRFGVPAWQGLYSEKITDEELVLVASPDLVKGIPLPMTAKDVVKFPLLHDAFNVGWDNWAAQVGLKPDQVNSQNIKYVDSAVLLEAALDRQGVALARHLLATRDIELGRLVRLDESCVPLRRSLHFVCRHGDQDRTAIRIFKKWLQSI